MATQTLNHRPQVMVFCFSFFLGSKGLSLLKNSTMTAMMAPSWITTSNMDLNSSEPAR